MREIHRSPLISPQKRASNAENVSIWWRHHPDRRVKLPSSLQLHTPGESSKGKTSMISSRCSPGQEKGFGGLCMVNWKSGDDDFAQLWLGAGISWVSLILVLLVSRDRDVCHLQPRLTWFVPLPWYMEFTNGFKAAYWTLASRSMSRSRVSWVTTRAGAWYGK